METNQKTTKKTTRIKEMKKATCEVCGKDFEYYPKSKFHIRSFCSSFCYKASRNSKDWIQHPKGPSSRVN